MNHSTPAPAIMEEARVPAYELPALWNAADDRAIPSAAAWSARRRELLERFAQEMYGRTPSYDPARLRWRTLSTDAQALEGRAVRKQIRVWFSETDDGPRMDLLVYQPGSAPPSRGWPVFLGLNFNGNHTIHADPEILLSDRWMRGDVPGVVDHRATPASRGTAAERWPVEWLLARGYAVATAYCGDLCPDDPAGPADPDGIGPLFSPQSGTEARDDDAWGAVGMWAWGLIRALDVLTQDSTLDSGRIAALGHSRLGKAALWAAAQDERFAAAFSNESGCGGAALSKRVFGETVALINHQFPHWFAKAFRAYNDREAALPFDQHHLLALIGPRPLYVASAAEDQWADPRGEFLALQHASPVYRWLGYSDLTDAEFPAPNQPLRRGRLGYHLRPGPHDLTVQDWGHFLDFADHALPGG